MDELTLDRLARARHRWQHPTFTLDMSPIEPGLSRRCGCRGWAETVREMLDLLARDEARAATDAAASATLGEPHE